MSELTVLIQRAHGGDAAAGEAVFGLLYEDLRRLARSRLSRTGRDTLLETTALVNEAFLRLAQAGSLRPEDRQSFLAYASRAMRSVVVDLVRSRSAERRGGGVRCLTLNTGVIESAIAGEEEIVRVHEALAELEAVDERMVHVVEMRYFAGLTEKEIADALGVTERTVRRDWEKARILLAAALKS